MNITLQCTGLIMLIVLLITTVREKSIAMNSRRLFLRTVYLCMVCLVLDIASVIAIVRATDGSFPHAATLSICKLYLVFLITQGFAGFLYVADEFFNEGTHKKFKYLYSAIYVLGCIAIMLLPIDYYYSGNVVYSLGPSTSATYTLAFIILVSTLAVAFSSKDGTSKRRKKVVMIWQSSWIVASVIQFIRPDLLVVGFAAAFGLIIVHSELENPQEGIDRTTGQFTANAMIDYVQDLYRQNKRFATLYIHVDYTAGDFDLNLEKTALIRIANFLDDGIGEYIFRQSDNDFSVIFSSREEMEKEYDRIRPGIHDAVDLPVNFHYTLIPDNSVFHTADEFQQFQHYNEKNVQIDECQIVGEHEAEEMRKYLKIRDTITWALANNTVRVFYQPIYDLRVGRFTSAEALVRIYDANGELMMPGSFIPIAEENGLIMPLGTEVFRQVCAFLATGKPKELGIEYIEVNLSMAQFSDDNPVSFVNQITSAYNVDPKNINLEITETADTSQRQNVLRNMEALIDTGVSFSLDDFGTGRSNLDYFVSMPVHIIKFDYKFTHWYFENETAKDVIEGTIAIIKKAGLPIVAEGVETKEQLDAMRKLGVTYIQGFYFSKAIPEENFLEFLKNNQTVRID